MSALKKEYGIHFKALSLAGRPDAAGGHLPASIRGPRRSRLQPSRFSHEIVGSSSREGAYAFSEMAGHVEISRGLYAPFVGSDQGMAGLETCGRKFFPFPFSEGSRGEVPSSPFPPHLELCSI